MYHEIINRLQKNNESKYTILLKNDNGSTAKRVEVKIPVEKDTEEFVAGIAQILLNNFAVSQTVFISTNQEEGIV